MPPGRGMSMEMKKEIEKCLRCSLESMLTLLLRGPFLQRAEGRSLLAVPPVRRRLAAHWRFLEHEPAVHRMGIRLQRMLNPRQSPGP